MAQPGQRSGIRKGYVGGAGLQLQCLAVTLGGVDVIPSFRKPVSIVDPGAGKITIHRERLTETVLCRGLVPLHEDDTQIVQDCALHPRRNKRIIDQVPVQALRLVELSGPLQLDRLIEDLGFVDHRR
jgi:hypothetical protein